MRFQFGSNGNDPYRPAVPSDPLSYNLGYDGFAIDNIHIEDRNRIILAENFTNDNAAGLQAPVPFINQIDFVNFRAAQTPKEIVKIEYHTTIGNGASAAVDAINKQDPADPAARAAFYGVTSAYQGFLDGTSKGANDKGTIQIDTLAAHWADSRFDSRSLVTSPIDIGVQALTPTSKHKGSFRIFGKIHSTQDLNPKGKYVIQVAVVEQLVNKIFAPYADSSSYVLRKLLPDASGIPLTIKTKNQDQVLDTLTWKIDSLSNIDPSYLYAIVFVQDVQNNFDVLQSSALTAIPFTLPVTGTENIFEITKVYPNPSDQEFTIQLPSPAQQSMKLTLANQLGQFTEVGAINEGEQSKKISTLGLADGVYILQLGSNGTALRTKVVVLHK